MATLPFVSGSPGHANNHTYSSKIEPANGYVSQNIFVGSGFTSSFPKELEGMLKTRTETSGSGLFPAKSIRRKQRASYQRKKIRVYGNDRLQIPRLRLRVSGISRTANYPTNLSSRFGTESAFQQDNNRKSPRCRDLHSNLPKESSPSSLYGTAKERPHHNLTRGEKCNNSGQPLSWLYDKDAQVNLPGIPPFKPLHPNKHIPTHSLDRHTIDILNVSDFLSMLRTSAIRSRQSTRREVY